MKQELLRVHALRLAPGLDLKAEIERFVAQHHIQDGWIETCVGSLTQTHLRFAKQPTGMLVNGYFEILSLVGTVSLHGCHLHVCVSDSAGQTRGGHLLFQNLIYTTAELVIGESDALVFTRKRDLATGFNELYIQQIDATESL